MISKTKMTRRGVKAARAVPGKRRAAARSTRSGLRAAKHDPSLRTLAHDERVHERLREGIDAAKTVYGRVSGHRGANALVDDRKTRRELRRAIISFRDAGEQVRAARARRRRRIGGVALVTMAGSAGGVALALNDELRQKALGLIPGLGDEPSGGGQSSSDAASSASGHTPGSEGLYPNPTPGTATTDNSTGA